MTAGTYSLNSGIIGLSGIITGGLTDKFGPRRVLLILGSLTGIGYLLMSQISTIWQFYAVYGIVVSIGLGAVTVPTLATVARWFLRRRGLMTGVVQAGAGIGGMILAPLAGWLILTHDWRYAFFILGITVLVFMLLSGLFLKRDPAQVGQLPYGADEAAEPGGPDKVFKYKWGLLLIYWTILT